MKHVYVASISLCVYIIHNTCIFCICVEAKNKRIHSYNCECIIGMGWGCIHTYGQTCVCTLKRTCIYIHLYTCIGKCAYIHFIQTYRCTYVRLFDMYIHTFVSMYKPFQLICCFNVVWKDYGNIYNSTYRRSDMYMYVFKYAHIEHMYIVTPKNNTNMDIHTDNMYTQLHTHIDVCMNLCIKSNKPKML